MGISENPVQSQRYKEGHNQGTASKTWPKLSREGATQSVAFSVTPFGKTSEICIGFLEMPLCYNKPTNR